MSRYKLKKGGAPRDKKWIGGLISGAATLLGSLFSTAGNSKAADSQSRAIRDAAYTQANAIAKQTENNTRLQKESIEFTKQQNRENRQIQQDLQTTLQLMAGKENMDTINESRKMQVKYGGKPKKSLKKLSYGGGDAPFRVTDGGGALPIDVDGAGYGLYEIYGNDHDHYHKTSSGKHKTGVGIKFPDGSEVEGEGNQNSNQGEYMFITPNDAMFISKHSIDGFNPAKAVNAGMNPIDAFAIQEGIKNDKGLNDDGSRKISLKRTRGKAESGRGITYYDPQRGHYVINREAVGNAIHSAVEGVTNLFRGSKAGSFGGGTSGAGGASDIYSPEDEYKLVNDTTYIPIPIVQTFNDAFGRARANNQSTFEFNGKTYNTKMGNNPNSVKAGNERTRVTVLPYRQITTKKVKVDRNKKSYGGQSVVLAPYNVINPFEGNPALAAGAAYASSPVEDNKAKCGKRVSIKSCGGRVKAASGYWNNYGGATLNAAGNLLGAGINIIGNQIAGKKLASAYSDAANYLINAYSQMKGIDMSAINKADYQAAKPMAAISTDVINDAPQREAIRRDLMKKERAIRNNTLSSAAQQRKLSDAYDEAYTRYGQVASDTHNKQIAIHQQNAQNIQNAAIEGARLEAEGNREYAKNYLAMLQYNNDIENMKYQGIGQAQADALTQSASAKASALQASMSSLGAAIQASGDAFATAYNTNKQNQINENATLMSTSDEGLVNYMERTGDMKSADALLNKYTKILDNSSSSKADKDRASIMIGRINALKDKKNDTTNNNIVVESPNKSTINFYPGMFKRKSHF